MDAARSHSFMFGSFVGVMDSLRPTNLRKEWIPNAFPDYKTDARRRCNLRSYVSEDRKSSAHEHHFKSIGAIADASASAWRLSAGFGRLRRRALHRHLRAGNMARSVGRRLLDTSVMSGVTGGGMHFPVNHLA